MDMITPFHAIWDKVELFKLDQPVDDAYAYWCGYAREFHEWLEEYILSNKNHNLISVNQAKVMLLDKYMEWRSFVPKKHQEFITVRGHTCIYHVFIQTCEHLRVTELLLNKPPLYIPAPPLPPRIEPSGPMLFLGPVEE